jgi:hypothetical protein
MADGAGLSMAQAWHNSQPNIWHSRIRINQRKGGGNFGAKRPGFPRESNFW